MFSPRGHSDTTDRPVQHVQVIGQSQRVEYTLRNDFANSVDHVSWRFECLPPVREQFLQSRVWRYYHWCGGGVGWYRRCSRRRRSFDDRLPCHLIAAEHGHFPLLLVAETQTLNAADKTTDSTHSPMCSILGNALQRCVPCRSTNLVSFLHSILTVAFALLTIRQSSTAFLFVEGTPCAALPY